MAGTIFLILFILIPIVWAVGMIKPKLFTSVLKSKTNRKWLTLILGVLFVVDVIAIGITVPPVEKAPENTENIVINSDNNQNAQEEKTNTSGPVSYEIVKIEDMSRKAIGDKSLSDYTTAELKKLPTNKRMSYKVVVPTIIKVGQVKPTVDKIISDLTNKDKDIDEIILDLYSDKEIISESWDVANAIWAPGGKLGNVDAETARDNDRSNYQVTVKIKDNLEQYLSQRNKSEDLYNLTENQRRQFFKDIVVAEDRAHREADKMYPTTNLNNFQMNNSEYDRLADIYREQVRKSYNITKEQGDVIMNEAFKENWPLD